MGEACSYTLNSNVFQIRELNYKKDMKLFDEIVEHENRVFGEGSVGKWNIKPFTKYGKVFVVVKKPKNLENNREVKCNNSTYENKIDEELVSVIEILRGFDYKIAYIYGVSTVTGYEGQGHATRLFDYVMDYLLKQDISIVELTVGVNNEAAKKVYRKAGFTIVEKLESEYGENIDRDLMRYTRKDCFVKQNFYNIKLITL